MRYSIPFGVLLCGAFGYVLLSASRPAIGQADADPAGRIKHLEECVQSLQRFALSSNLRELRRLLPSLGLTPDAQTKASAALEKSLNELAKSTVDQGAVRAAMEEYVAALRSDAGKSRSSDCLDECQKTYDADHAACQNIHDGIDRANCDIAASNKMVNCQDNCATKMAKP